MVGPGLLSGTVSQTPASANRQTLTTSIYPQAQTRKRELNVWPGQALSVGTPIFPEPGLQNPGHLWPFSDAIPGRQPVGLRRPPEVPVG
jgi:hypothetical protein